MSMSIASMEAWKSHKLCILLGAARVAHGVDQFSLSAAVLESLKWGQKDGNSPKNEQ